MTVDKANQSSRRYLVTGAMGCVGAWAIKRLLQDGTHVSAYDLSGDSYRLRTIMDDDAIAAVNFISGDITDLEAFKQAVADNGITHVLHLAAMQVPLVRADPVLGARVNLVGTTVVFETARQLANLVQNVVFASSFGVYGEPEAYPPGPLAHDAPLLPPTLYGVFKQCNEGTAGVYWRENSVHSVGLRPCVVYGPGRDQGWTSTPTKAMLAAALGRPYQITYGGTLVYHHAEDVAAALITASTTPLEGAPVFNIGGSTVSMEQIVSAINEVVPGAAATITFDPKPLPHPSSADDSALNEALGPLSYRPLVEGVRDTINTFREAIDSGRLDVERALRA
jgi:UDP-glucuronate 4-epimerase